MAMSSEIVSWEQAFGDLTLEHIFSDAELAEMTPLEKRLLKAYLREGFYGLLRLSGSKFLREHKKKREEVLNVLRSERFATLLYRVNAFLQETAFENLRHCYFNLLIRLARGVMNGERIRRTEITLCNFLRKLLTDYEMQLANWEQQREAERFLNGL